MSTSKTGLQSGATAGAVAVLKELARDNSALEKNTARRVLADVVRAWPGDVSRLWFKWIVEAASSLGIRAKALDCSVEQACELARNEARLVCFRQAESGEPEWLAVLDTARGRFRLMTPPDQQGTKWVSLAVLRETLQSFAENGLIRCVAIDGHLRQTLNAAAEARPRNPLDRLWHLLKPESGDLWLVVVFGFVVSLLMLATPIAVETLVNTVAFGRFLQPIVVLALILLTFLVIQGLVRALQTYVVELIQRRLFARVAGDLAFRLPRVKGESVDGHYVPELVNRFFDVVTVQKVAAQLLLDGLSLTLNTVVGLAVLAFYHPWLLGFDLILLVAIAVAIFGLGRGAVPTAIKESKYKYQMAAWLEDIARCPVAFHSDGGADFALERADHLLHDYLDARRKHFRIVMRQVLFALGLQAFGSTVLLGLGGWLVVSGELTLGQLVAAELIVTIIVGSFAKFGKHMESFYDLLASVDKLGILFDLRMERPDGILSSIKTAPATFELSSVRVPLPGGAAIGPISCRIESGEHVAVFGPSGSGKSTFLDLLYGVRRCDSGHLTIDDVDPRDLRPDVLRGRVALARGGEVFHGTIEENVHMHRHGITTSDVRSVLKAVGILAPILRLPEGCSAVLASNGAPLSDSQRRLIGLARAIAGMPGVLLVDGLLDSLSARQMDELLDYLTSADRPWTLIVATVREDVARRFGKRIDLPGN